MSWFWFSITVLHWVIRVVMVPVILRRRYSPTVATAWLGMIFFLPLIGLVVYLLVGENRLGKRRVYEHRAVIASMRSEARLAGIRRAAIDPKISTDQALLIRQAEGIGGMPIVGGNQVEFIGEGTGAVERLIQDIEGAREHVHLLFYIFAPDAMGRLVADALVRAVSRGVRCRLLADGVGSRRLFGRRGLAQQLRAAGVEVRPALPADLFRRRLARLDLRNHRKMAVIDGRVAYAGSQNIVDPDTDHRHNVIWCDLMGRFTGPLVQQLQLVFLEDWAFETDQELAGPDIFPQSAAEPAGDTAAQVVPTGPSQASENFRRVLLAAIHLARARIFISSPYIVLDEPTLVALSMAAQRGVEVNLIIPNRSDHPLATAAGRAWIDDLLTDGVKVHFYRGGMLHSKTMTVDDSFALLGSANLDVRSFFLNFEINVLMYGPRITQELRRMQGRYIADSTPLDPAAWSARSRLSRYVDSAAALLSPLL